jgi:SAM-dependent methyltransferase
LGHAATANAAGVSSRFGGTAVTRSYAQRVVDVYRARNFGPAFRYVWSKLPSRHRRLADLGGLVDEPWCLDRVEITDREVVARGWSLPPLGVASAPREFRLNDRPFEIIRHPLARRDVAAVFPMRPNGELCGFECRSTLTDAPYMDGVLRIERVRPQATALDRGRDCSFVADPALHTDLPDPDRRFRVIGNRDASGFLDTGATDYRRLDHALRAVAGRGLHEFDRVLDWGSGCGRVARHFPGHRAQRLTGCDIDHDNVRWCTEHMAGTFVASGVVPPLPFEREAFDVVYGISVFTHLREALQMKWLDELARVTRRGAYLLMTVHGRNAIEFAQLPREDQLRLAGLVEQAGLLVASSNSQIDGFAEHHGEYVNVFHSADYIRDTWGRRFEVLAILPGYIFTHDLVVMRG